MNFFHLKVVNAIVPINQSLVVDKGEISSPDPVITHNGAKILECLCGDDIWRIECYPLKSSSHWSTLQKKIKHFYKQIMVF
jgi:hypothetical protein